MTTQGEFEIDPEKAAADAAAAAMPDEVKGKSVTEIWKMVEAERARAAEISKGKERAEQLAQEIAMAALEQRRPAAAQPPVPAATEPDREADPEGWMAFKVKQQVDATIKPFMENYTRDKSMVVGGMLDTAKARVAAQFPDYAEHAKAIEEFTRNYPAEVLAQPGAYEEAYYRVKGMATVAKEREARVREQAGLESGGRVGVGARDEGPKLTEEQTRIATNFGISATEHAALSGAGTVTIDDYLATKAKGVGGTHATR
jgi:hypothetical protein